MATDHVNTVRLYDVSSYAALPGDADTPLERFLNDLDDCRLHIAVQWLAWSLEWTPPAEHAHDWVSEAISVADRIRARS